ncbi:MAG: DUF1579 family protein [Gemmatimonadota bacterium]
MSKPTEAHRRLEKLAGVWVGEENMAPSPWSPEGHTATGRSEVRVALDGLAAIADYRQEREGSVTFRGHGVYTYDPAEDQYLLHWFDCMSPGPEVFRGGFEDGVLTLTSHGPQGHARLTADYSVEGRMANRMELSPDGESWTTVFDGRYDRRTG